MITSNRSGKRWLVLTRLLFAFLATSLGAAFLLALLGGAFFALVAHKVREGDWTNFDAAIVGRFREPDMSFLRQIAGIYTWLGNGPIVGTVTLGSTIYFVLRKRWWPDGAAVFTAGVGGFLLIELLKTMFGRPRPEGAWAAGLSFPSGHSFLGIAVYGLLCHRAGIRARYWIFPCMAVGMTRPILGVHYPTDVLAGWSAGAAWLMGCLAFPRNFSAHTFPDWRHRRVAELLASRRRLGKLRSLRPALAQSAGVWSSRIRPRWGRHFEGDLVLLSLLARLHGEKKASTAVLQEAARLFGIRRE